MKLIFVSRKLSTISKHLKNSPSDWLAVVEEIDKEPKLFEKNRIVTTRKLQKEMFNNTDNDKTLESKMKFWLKKWPNIPIYDEKTLKEVLRIDDTSLWWFGESMLYRSNLGDNPSFREIIIRLEAFKYLFTKHSNAKAIISDNWDFNCLCAAIVCKKLGIPFKIFKKKNVRITSKKSYPLMIRNIKRSRLVIRNLVSKTIKHRFLPRDTEHNPVLIMAYYLHLENTQKSGSNKLPRDRMLHPIITNLPKAGFNSRMMYIDRRLNIGLDSLKSFHSPAFPYDLYAAPFQKEIFNYYKKMKSVWKELETSKEFKKSMTFDHMDLWPLMKDYLAFLFLKQFPEAVECIKSMERALTVEKPKAVIIHNEAGFYGRAMIIAAKRCGVKTIGVQHGSIDEHHMEYSHSGEGQYLSCPVPDIMAVWGPKDKEILLKSDIFTEENVQVTGIPRYDNLHGINKKKAKKKISTRLDIKGKKIIAVTTQPFDDISYRKIWLRSIALAARKINAVFIIKPHPAESTAMHKNLCKKIGGDNLIVIKDIDIFELLAAADLTITAWSTTGLESLILGTPLLTVNLTGYLEKIPYVSSGAAFGAENHVEIPVKIKEALAGPNKDMSEKQKSYVYDYAYKVDGMASQRVVDIIKNIIEEGERL